MYDINIYIVAAPVIMSRNSRLGPEPTTAPPKKDSSADPEVLQKANDIIKDRSADCKPRQVCTTMQTAAFFFTNTVFWLL